MSFEIKGMNVFKIIGWVFIGLIIAAVTAFLFGVFVMLLWNWLMPDLFGLGEISYIQAWGLVLLSHILFKSGHSGPGRHNNKFHRRFEGKGHGRGKHEHYKEDWKREFFSKMQEYDINAQNIEEKKEEKE